MLPSGAGRLPGVEPGELHPDGALPHPVGRQLLAERRRVHRQDPGEPGRVVRDVVAGSESDLQHLAVQPARDPGPDRPVLRCPHRQLDNPRQHPIPVPAHNVTSLAVSCP